MCSIGRLSAEISRPQGRSVGPPKSSWFHQFPNRPMPCATRSAGATQSSSAEMLAPERFATIAPTTTPSPIPPQTPSPPFQIANGPHHSSGSSSQLVTHVVQARADDPEGDPPDREAEDEVPVAAAVGPADPRDDDRRDDRDQQRQAHRSGSRTARARACSSPETGWTREAVRGPTSAPIVPMPRGRRATRRPTRTAPG